MYMYIICIKCVLRQFVKVTAPFDVSGVALVQLLRSLLLLRSHLCFFRNFYSFNGTHVRLQMKRKLCITLLQFLLLPHDDDDDAQHGTHI